MIVVVDVDDVMRVVYVVSTACAYFLMLCDFLTLLYVATRAPSHTFR